MDIIKLMILVWLDLYLFPHWMHDRTPDPLHPYRRLFTRKHQRKRNLVKSVWIGAGLLILVHPVLHIMLLIALPATLLSFAILDETL